MPGFLGDVGDLQPVRRDAGIAFCKRLLDENCRGTLLFNGGPSYDIVAAADGDIVWMFQTNPNTVFQGTATRYSR